MAMTLRKFKRSRGAKGAGGRFPADARTWATHHAKTRLEGGWTTTRIAAELEVSDVTLRAWLYDATRESSGQLCEVIVAEPEPPPPPPPAVSLTTAQGHVVTGLDVESVAALLRAIA